MAQTRRTSLFDRAILRRLYRKSAYLPTAVRALLGVAQDWKGWLPHAGDVFPINEP